MKRIGIAALLTALILLFCACGRWGATSTPTPTAPGAPPTAAAQPEATPKPAATEPQDTAANAPAPTPSPIASAAKANEYYIVEQNGRRGVVDDTGKVVLPARFSQVEDISYGGGPHLFFAVPAEVNTAKEERDQSGELYTADGDRLTDRRYWYAYGFNKDVMIIGMRTEAGGSTLVGLMDYKGKMVVPTKYYDIFELPDGYIASSSEKVLKDVDVYDRQGKLKRSGTINFRYTTAQYIVAADKAGAKEGLMDSSFQWVVPPAWDDIRQAGENAFVVTQGGLRGVIDLKGQEVLPVRYYDIIDYPDMEGGGPTYYTTSAPDGASLMDSQWKTLFHSAKYANLRYYDGVLLATDFQSVMHAIDFDDKQLVPPADSVNWNSSTQMFECSTYGNREYAYYTRDGKKLSFPKTSYVQFIRPDRFLLREESSSGDVKCSVCDAAGSVIIPATEQLEIRDENTLVFGARQGKQYIKYGLMDADGNILVPAKFDSLYGYPGRTLMYAQVGMIRGLVDRQGKWVWYTSDYDGLMD